MQADEARSAGCTDSGGQFGDGDRGGVGGDDGALLADLVQSLKDVGLDLENFQGCLYNQIAVCVIRNTVCRAGDLDVVHGRGFFFLGHLTLGHTLCQHAVQALLAVLCKLQLNVAQNGLITCLCKAQSDLGAHHAGANDAKLFHFHLHKPPIYCT